MDYAFYILNPFFLAVEEQGIASIFARFLGSMHRKTHKDL